MALKRGIVGNASKVTTLPCDQKMILNQTLTEIITNLNCFSCGGENSSPAATAANSSAHPPLGLFLALVLYRRR